MPCYGTGRFTDAEGYQANLPDVTTDLVVAQAGLFGAQLTWAKFPHLHLLRARENLARVAHISLPPTLVFVSFSTRPDVGLFWNGLALRADDMVFHGCGERLHQRTTGPSHWGFLALAPAFFGVYGSALAGRDLVAPAAGQILRSPTLDLRRLLDMHARVGRLIETSPRRLGHPELIRALEHELLHALVTCLTSGEGQEGPPRWRRSIEVMTRLEAILAACPGQVPRVPDLSAILGVQERTLGTCCAAFLGIGPSRYLRLRRLKLIRATMLRADPATVRVGDIARRYGFTDVGRFAGAYERAFGETPATTLARLKNVSG